MEQNNAKWKTTLRNSSQKTVTYRALLVIRGLIMQVDAEGLKCWGIFSFPK